MNLKNERMILGPLMLMSRLESCNRKGSVGDQLKLGNPANANTK